MNLELFLQRLIDFPRKVLNLLIPERCAYCGAIRNFKEERQKPLTPHGVKFHREWCLCEECQDLFEAEPLNSCIHCGTFFSKKEFATDGCQRCKNRHLWFNRVIPFGRYQQDLRAAVFLMKKRGGERLTRTFAHLFFEYRAFSLQSVQPDVILPVPMHAFYRWVRGTNDAQILAQELGKILRIPYDERIVKCVRLTMAQRAVRMVQRNENVRGVFAPWDVPPDRVRWLGKRAMIVDDVMTTGSTVNELAKILKTEFGFADVTVAVLARAKGQIQPRMPDVTQIEVHSSEIRNSYSEMWQHRKRNSAFRKKKIRKFNSGQAKSRRSPKLKGKKMKSEKEFLKKFQLRSQPVRIGTRASQLALWQANWCAGRLQEHGVPVEIVRITASGDRPETFSQPIAGGGAQGIFTKEIQDALLDGRVDLAVHSLKDLPTEIVPGLQLTAVPERAPVEDVLVLGRSPQTLAKFAQPSGIPAIHSLSDLPDGTVLGTSSLRRRAQLLAYARLHGKKWEIQSIRGNLNTRFRKLDEGQFDVLILARAGVERLEMADRISAILPMEEIFPAVSQGALGIETRAEEPELTSAIRFFLNDESVFQCVTAERTLLKALDGGCATPIGGHCQWNEKMRQFTLRGRVIAIDGRTFLEESRSGTDPLALGQEVARKLIARGADALIREARNG